MIILGINGRPGFKPESEVWAHDSGATLFIDGKLFASTNEERFTRKKYEGQFPKESITRLLKRANLKLTDIDMVGYTGNTFDDYYVSPNSLKDKFKKYFPKAKIKYVDHHLAHAMSTFLSSDFKSSVVFTLDGSGDDHGVEINKVFKRNELKRNVASLFIAIKNPFKIIRLQDFYLSASPGRWKHEMEFGNFYTISSELCYYRMNPDINFNEKNEIHRESYAGKIMGLSAYGNASKTESHFSDDALLELYQETDEHFPTVLFKFDSVHSLEKELKQILFKNKPENIAAWTQHIFETYLLKYFEKIKDKELSENLCFGGGCALNILLNSKILEHKLFKDVHINTAPSDAGLNFGVAAYLAKKYDAHEHEYQIPTNIGCIGLDYSDEDAMDAYAHYEDQLEVEKFENDELYDLIANALVENKIIGWHQGRSEYGPRALGNRSIFANPTFDNKELLNTKVKKREWWRPYAAIVMEEHVHDWFNLPKENSHYMLFSSTVKDDHLGKIPSITHVDNSCRIQTVNPEINQKAYDLLKVFNEKTGVPCLLNTSFNTKPGEPIVETPKDAIESFLYSQMDLLVINNFVFRKKALDNGTEV